ncbi:DUF3786 domain-containing protein [Thermodesulfobacteriota bacterium]
MVADSSVFEKTYKGYLAQVGRIDLRSIERKLDVQVEGAAVMIPLLGKPHRVSGKGVADPSGKRTSFDISVILCKYILLCPDEYPGNKEWTSYRDLKDSGPLTSYFANDVERAISEYFEGRVGDLKEACKELGGYSPDIELSYDISMQFDLLPRIPVLMLYNDADDDFPARCSVLFERRAENYLDAECLAMVGRLLFTCLKEKEDTPR